MKKKQEVPQEAGLSEEVCKHQNAIEVDGRVICKDCNQAI